MNTTDFLDKLNERYANKAMNGKVVDIIAKSKRNRIKNET